MNKKYYLIAPEGLRKPPIHICEHTHKKTIMGIVSICCDEAIKVIDDIAICYGCNKKNPNSKHEDS